ncbi:non-ribosomal peptide synthetase [Chitinophaga sp. Ak27]|uniref:non-ribosomal peptide synthetase n=1 Tax=Chitinophaga sp. Ak27 TaxID=2726116 RepID=UPI00145E36CB|nr:non-ribosomal peptide synthetase [Chitinophaga sp. Ak27]NLU93277.1 amino acid adenylation domain-containing protein [Chitinophaga sp. Ak27]
MKDGLNAELNIIAGQSVKEKSFWLERLADFNTRTVIGYDITGHHPERRVREHTYCFSDKATVSLIRLSRASDAGLQVLLAASVALFLYKYNGSQQIVLATAIDRQDTDSVFINTLLPLITKLHGDASFKDVIVLMKGVISEALKHQNYPLHILFKELGLLEDKETHPLFDVGILLKNIQDSKHLEEAKLNFIFLFERIGNSIICSIQYNESKYSETTIASLVNLFTGLLDRVLQDVYRPLKEIPLLDDAGRMEVQLKMAPEAGDFPLHLAIPDLFRAQVAANRFKIAIACQEQEFTYDWLDHQTDLLAWKISRQIPKGSIVILLLERSIDTVVAMLGVLKAGAIFLPIETGTPESRVRYIIGDSQAALILTHSSTWQKMEQKGNAYACNMFCMDTDDFSEPPGDLPAVDAGSPAYIIYTSGSTGYPKGVVIQHKSCVNLLYGMNDRIFGKYGPGQVMGLVSPFVFDACMQLTFGALLFGHRLQIITNEEKSDGRKLLQSYDKYGVSITDGTPAHLQLILQSGAISASGRTLRHIIYGGDTLYKSKIKAFFELAGSHDLPMITNVYGPTECTVNATSFDISAATLDEVDEVPIGRPLPNYRTYILNEQGEVCPVGGTGELCIAGEGLTMGYLNNIHLTHDKIRYVPALKDTVYFTGDIVTLKNDGQLYFTGRKDRQIKVRGYRIEMGEIERQLNSHPQIRRSALLAKADEETTTLIAYYSAVNVTPDDLREYLVERLPQFMVPPYLVQLEELPLLPNGKINHRILPDPLTVIGSGPDNTSPENEIEQQLLEVWKSNLQLSNIGVNEHYFNIGGDSIKTISLLYDINERFNVHFNIVDLYRYDTIRKFAAALMQAEASAIKDDYDQEVEIAMDLLKKDILNDFE